MTESNNPKVSVIVTTKNEEENIKNFCESVKNQSYKNLELIVVDNNSTDKTVEIAKEYTGKVYNVGPERSAQRNYGIEIAEGDYVLIADADMILTENVVRECVEYMLKDPNIKAIVIPEKSVGNNYWGKCKSLEREFYFLAGDEKIEAARFFCKQALDEVGYYDISITGGEDWELSERVLAKYPNKARTKSYIIHNEGNLNLIKLLKKKYYYAKGFSAYTKKTKTKLVGSKTIYFLRPVFYKYPKLWLRNPLISMGTIIMLGLETIAGAAGLLEAKFKRSSCQKRR